MCAPRARVSEWVCAGCEACARAHLCACARSRVCVSWEVVFERVRVCVTARISPLAGSVIVLFILNTNSKLKINVDEPKWRQL